MLPALPVEDLLGGGIDLWFGRLCHLVIERGIKAFFSRPVPPGLPLEADCPVPEFYRRLLAAAEALAEAFFLSSFGAEILGAGPEAVETEVPFTMRMPSGPGFVSGIMDLVVRFEDRTRIVDFKTDGTVLPGSHDVQLGIYRRAAESIWGRPSESFLYYLRSGEAVRTDSPLPDFSEVIPQPSAIITSIPKS